MFCLHIVSGTVGKCTNCSGGPIVIWEGVGPSCVCTFKPACLGYYSAYFALFLVHISDRLPTALPCVALSGGG